LFELEARIRFRLATAVYPVRQESGILALQINREDALSGRGPCRSTALGFKSNLENTVMAIHVQCAGCKAKFQAPEKLAGNRVM
jgi:hypothetical protein